ncbi:alpha/beta hydrolase [Mesorhizobium muleiense]|uniref:alpha/beta fold hydrolase n=1 Tax=Mesorhizobium muleiense TaxID=1004279 RepID=UPI001F3E3625|nr:alpha/beta fold hydrolase [Mesorhizobium muleiense]MCF6115635.1 alpha/beta hydrolase [Mesorhizobium muleiense]
MFAGFRATSLQLDDTTIFARVGGTGPPLLLLHGFPETHLMWRDIAAALAPRFTVVVADLRGYGQSGCPVSSAEHSPYAKRAMAGDMVQVMQQLGFGRIKCPLLALWSSQGGLETWYAEEGGPLAIWRKWADRVEGGPVPGGHFFPEEHPHRTAAALSRFFEDE